VHQDRPPGPRAHLRGTRALLAALQQHVGASLDLDALLGAEADLPEAPPPDRDGLKYDAYLTRSAAGWGWGLTVNDRFEGARFWPRIERFVQALGDYDLGPAHALSAALGSDAVRTVGLGFDPGRPPRVKLYVQEDAWGAGLQSVPDLPLPAWARGRRVDVVTVDVLQGGTTRQRVYVGGPTPHASAAGAPAEVQRLADTMAQACPLGPGWYYTTIRLDDPPRYAVNKIYDHTRIGFARRGLANGAAWAEVRAAFAAMGQAEHGDALQAIRRGLPGVRVVPTASALDHAGDSVDIYMGAWAL